MKFKCFNIEPVSTQFFEISYCWILFFFKHKQHLDKHTPSAFSGQQPSINCSDVESTSLDFSKFKMKTQMKAGQRQAIVNMISPRLILIDISVNLLKECGFVILKKFFDKQLLQNVYENFETFKKSPEALPFRYPCQGVGRFEYMLPFAPPFNTSIVYQDRRLHDILFEFLQSRFKLELQTIITSEPGAGFQRFHQGHQGLFHPSERLPPYAVVVGVTPFF